MSAKETPAQSGSQVVVFRAPREDDGRDHAWTCRFIRAGALHGPCDCGAKEPRA